MRLDIVDLDFDLVNQTVTLFGLWEEDGEMPEAMVPATNFWRMVEAKAEGEDWTAHLPDSERT